MNTLTGRRRLEYKAWTPSEDARLTKLWKTKSLNRCAALMGRGTGSIYNRVQKLGLKRTEQYKAITGCGQFKAGQASWNTGMKGWQAGGRAKDTQFKLGERPSNTWRPIGAERVSSDQILYRKVSDTGDKRQDWRTVHTLVWEEQHGPLPAGMIVIFLDKDRANLDPANLRAITKAENMQRNGIGRYPPEYRASAIALGWFKRKLNKLEQHNADPE